MLCETPHLPPDVSRKLSASSSSMLCKFLIVVTIAKFLIEISVVKFLIKITFMNIIILHLEVLLTHPNNDDWHWEGGGGNDCALEGRLSNLKSLINLISEGWLSNFKSLNNLSFFLGRMAFPFYMSISIFGGAAFKFQI